jgi:hypothetical protein
MPDAGRFGWFWFGFGFGIWVGRHARAGRPPSLATRTEGPRPAAAHSSQLTAHSSQRSQLTAGRKPARANAHAHAHARTPHRGVSSRAATNHEPQPRSPGSVATLWAVGARHALHRRPQRVGGSVLLLDLSQEGIPPALSQPITQKSRPLMYGLHQQLAQLLGG